MACSKLEARGHLLHKTGTPPKQISWECMSATHEYWSQHNAQLVYRKVASTNASRLVTRLVYYHTQNDNFLQILVATFCPLFTWINVATKVCQKILYCDSTLGGHNVGTYIHGCQPYLKIAIYVLKSANGGLLCRPL